MNLKRRNPFIYLKTFTILLLILCAQSPQLSAQTFTTGVGLLWTNALRTPAAPLDEWQQEELRFWNDTTNNWDPNFRATYIRDSLSRPTEILISSHGPNGFELTNRRLISYFSNTHSPVEILTQTRTGNNWEDNLRERNSFDAQGNRTMKILESWTGANWDLLNGNRFSHTYDNNNRLLESIQETAGSNGVYTFTLRELYSYSTANEVDTIWVDNWSGSAWEPLSRVIDLQWFDFNQTLPLGSTTQNASSNGLYVNSGRVSFTYSANNSSVQTNQIWLLGNWENVSRFSNTIDAQRRRVYLEQSVFSNGNWIVSLGDSSEFIYNATLQPDTLTRRTLDTTNSTYNNLEQVIYSYGPVGQIEPELPPSFQLFPNPVHGVLNLKSFQAPTGEYRMDIYDLQGKIVQTQTWRQGAGHFQHQLSLEGLPTGFYTYRIQGAERSQSGNLIVQ